MTKHWEIEGPRRFVGELRVPSDKSITHRALILGGIARGETRIRTPLNAADCRATAQAMVSLGAKVKKGAKEWVVTGVGTAGLQEPDNVLDVRNSGTSMRLLAGVLAAQPFFSVLTGDDSLRRRPMRRIVEPLRQIGADIDGRDDGDHAPLVLRGGSLRAAEHELPIASAQVKSCMLLAGLFVDGDTSVREPHPSRDHTERMLAAFGVPITYEPGYVKEHGGGLLEAVGVLNVPADFSSAAFFLVGASACAGSQLDLTEVGTNPTRTGMLHALTSMGADIVVDDEIEVTGEPRATLHVTHTGELTGGQVEPEQIPQMIDEVPVFALAALRASEPTAIRGARELRVKESDRVEATQRLVRAFGGVCETSEDTLTIEPAGSLQGAEIDSGGDHRIAMAAAIAACMATGKSVIHDVACVDTSYPHFLEDLLEHTEPGGTP